MFYRHANLQRTCNNNVSIMKALVNYKLSFDYWYCALKNVLIIHEENTKEMNV